ncbi:peptidoglycan recognition protein 3 [Andrena cerasifolii]|uniref:peptidoglycan recognition protein 3 n=1 Tax=Andrena cerasifolii TaxID=2819439 RepID=UPI0040378E56
MGSSVFLASALISIVSLENAVLSLPVTWANFENDTEVPRIVTRKEWGARPPVERVPMEVTPTPYVVIHHGGIKQYCYDQKTCSAIVRSYQNYHIDDRGWFDIGYSFVIGEDGNAYEGRGWDYVGAHAPGYNTQSIGICVIGDFSDFLPNDAALNTLNALIDYGVSLGKISESYHVLGHRQARDTLCPGDEFYKYVQTNPRWTKHPIPKYSNATAATEPVTAASRSSLNAIKSNSKIKGITWFRVKRLKFPQEIKIIHTYIVSLMKKTCANIITADVTELSIINKGCVRYSLLGSNVSVLGRAKMDTPVFAFLLLAILRATFGAEHETPVRPNIISRADWGAKSPKWSMKNLATDPPPFIIVHHSATDGCTTRAICQARLRSFQNYHMNEKGWGDIGYNFVVGEDGNVYEGRGWGKHGAHSVSYNSKSIGICVIGNFVGHNPNAAAIQAIQTLISYGVSIGKIKEDYTLLGHRQTASTTCPGDSLYRLLETWPRWSSSV